MSSTKFLNNSDNNISISDLETELEKSHRVKHDIYYNSSDSEDSLIDSRDLAHVEDASTQNIVLKHLKVNRTVGEGGFGLIASAINPSTHQIYAVKIMKNFINCDNFVRKVKNELNLVKKLNHPNITKVFQTSFINNIGYIVMEFYPFGDLNKFILNHHPFSETVVKRLSWQMTSALRYLHNQQIAHRDIKPENFLLDQYYEIKLCDFGFTGHFKGSCSTFAGTFLYFSPQQVARKYNPFKSDVWALGMSMYQLLTNEIPFEIEELCDLGITSISEFIDFPIRVSQKLKNLIQKMLIFDEDKRIDIDEVANNRWFETQRDFYKSASTNKQAAGLTPTDSISNLNEFRRFRSIHKQKTYVFFGVEDSLNLVVDLLEEILKSHKIQYSLKENTFRCQTSSKHLKLLIYINYYSNKRTTIKFLKTFGCIEDYFQIIQKIVENIYGKINK